MTARFAIARDATTKTATLTVAMEGPWQAFAGKDMRSVDFSAPVAAGAETGSFPLPGSSWTIFAVRQNGKEHFLAERQLPMKNGYNFRDLGGIPGHSGKLTVWGKLFRTDDLQNLTQEDAAYLATIPLTTIVDFRTHHERDKRPDTVLCSVKNALHYPIMPGNLNPHKNFPEDFGDIDEFMLAIYREFVRDQAITSAYRTFFRHVQENADLPLLFHCSAGKDRTGFAAAMLLFALGVDREIIFSDYEASNAYLGDKYAPIIAANPEHGGLFTVKRAYLEESLRVINEEHGNVETYLSSMLAVDIALMRERFVA
jgi:protein-tyrosine phosphatase